MNVELTILYDYYGELLTKKQQLYFEDYYFNNLSLQEIADNNKISRNAVHKSIKDITNKLNYYEEILGLYHKRNKIINMIRDLDEKTQERIKELI